MKKNIGILLLIILLLIVVDQLSKYLFYDIGIFSGSFFFSPLFNTGISRGIPMPIFLTLAISFFCIFLFSYLYYKNYLTLWEMALVIAGTMGNLLDRCILGGVRDFISLGTFPVFNLADAFLTAAVVLLCIRELLHLQKTKKKL